NTYRLSFSSFTISQTLANAKYDAQLSRQRSADLGSERLVSFGHKLSALRVSDYDSRATKGSQHLGCDFPCISTWLETGAILCAVSHFTAKYLSFRQRCKGRKNHHAHIRLQLMQPFVHGGHQIRGFNAATIRFPVARYQQSTHRKILKYLPENVPKSSATPVQRGANTTECSQRIQAQHNLHGGL